MINDSYFCKVCNKKLTNSYDNYNCSLCDYSISTKIVYNFDPDEVQDEDDMYSIHTIYETYIINNNFIEIFYLDKVIIINNKEFNLVNFYDYELDDVLYTYSFNTIKTILDKYIKYRNIL